MCVFGEYGCVARCFHPKMVPLPCSTGVCMGLLRKARAATRDPVSSSWCCIFWCLEEGGLPCPPLQMNRRSRPSLTMCPDCDRRCCLFWHLARGGPCRPPPSWRVRPVASGGSRPGGPSRPSDSTADLPTAAQSPSECFPVNVFQ